MKKNVVAKVIVALSAMLLIGCINTGSSDNSNVKVFQFRFNSEDPEWQIGYADYPAEQTPIYEFESGWRALPSPHNIKGIYVSGNNLSDDLLMFIKRRLVGFEPYMRYQLTFKMQIASNAGVDCVGIGGAPGESVFIKAGATTFEPEGEENSQGYIRMNADFGGQSIGGTDAVVIGDFSSEKANCSGSVYALKDLESTTSMDVTTNDDGVLWAVFATDSGFEGTTSIYYTYLEIQAKKIE